MRGKFLSENYLKNKNTFLKGFLIFSKKKKVSSKNETEKYRFAEK